MKKESIFCKAEQEVVKVFVKKNTTRMERTKKLIQLKKAK